jgi:multidrug efflux system membrane fusion protein
VAFAIVLLPTLFGFHDCAAWAQSPVVTAAAAIRDMPTYVKAIGTVVASKTTIVRSDIKGQLTAIDFTAGQQVQSGDLLARVNVRDNLAQSDKTDLASTEVRSPASGIAGKPLYHVGDIVAPADRMGLVAISRIDPISVEFTLPGIALPTLRQHGADGHIRAWAYGEDKVHPLAEGELALGDNGSLRRTHEGVLKATFPNGDEALSPGMRVEIQVRGNSSLAALTVPVSAVQRSASGYFVYLVTTSHTAHVRPINLGTVTGGVAVVRDGLGPGDIVITDGQNQLAEGSRVAIVGGPSPPERRP